MAESRGETAVTPRQYSLRHVKHESRLNNTLYSMLLEQNLVDVILSCDTTNISAHRLILSANSSYFKALFDSLESNRCQIPVVFLKDVPLSDLQAIMEFMYRGEVSVDENQLPSVLKSAELLKVFGLTEVSHALKVNRPNEATLQTTPQTASQAPPPPSDSNPIPHKRPRISEGIQQTPHTTQEANKLSSRISSTRSATTPNTSAVSSSSHSNQQQLRLQLSAAIAKTSALIYTPSVVKNVILPPTQIHRKTDSSGAQNASKDPKTVTNVNPIPVMSSPENSSQLKSYSRRTTTNPLVMIPLVNPNQILSPQWTPSHPSAEPLPSSSGTRKKISGPVEVLIDEESNEEEVDSEQDIKPPIFELNQSLSKDVVILNVETDSPNKSFKSLSPNKSKAKSPEMLKSNANSSLRSIKSRTPSISSQSSLPPPPSYRVVQRSSSRMLRKIIIPTAVASTSSALKSKDNSEEKNKSGVKREKTRLLPQRLKKAERLRESGPEVECPSCGLKFNDEKKWNEHITSAHPPSQT